MAIPCPKPKHKRRTKTRKERGRVTNRAAAEVIERAGGKCEMCKLPPVIGSHRDRMEIAHIENRSQGGRGDVPWNLLHVCGPSVNSGTCHHFIDYTKEGREKAREISRELKERYDPAEWPA
jgi:hypothetical protein